MYAGIFILGILITLFVVMAKLAPLFASLGGM